MLGPASEAAHVIPYEGDTSTERGLADYGPEVLEAYRLTWRPSFNPAVYFRVARRTDGYFAYINLAPEHLPLAFPVQPAVRRLTEQEWDSIFLAPWDGFWTSPPGSMVGGLDGTGWMIEGYQKGGRYHAVAGWGVLTPTLRRWAAGLVSVAPGHIAFDALD